MDDIEILFDQAEEAVSIMREVAAWGRGLGFCVWPDEWLTMEELITADAQPENFCVGKINGISACAFILQWQDSEYWKSAPKYEAAYLHKFCVRREFAHRGMTKSVISAIKSLCFSKGISYIRLDTGPNEEVVKNIYLDAGFHIVDTIRYPNGNSIALYELKI